MKKIKNKFIILVILLTLSIATYQAYKYYNIYNIDTNSYVLLVEWKWLLNQNELYIDEKKLVSSWDKVETIGSWSIAVLEWWDWSITRLGWDTSIIIEENYVSKDLTKINMAFRLFKWKSWSNVINYMWSGSYFKEYINDIEAWVRWTIFNVDLDNNYIHVINHKVTLKTKEGESFDILENSPFSLETFSFIDLREFILNVKDRAWEDINKNFDIKFINSLKAKLKESLKNNNPLQIISEIDINKLNLEEKNEVYNKLLSSYQKLNTIDPRDQELFEIKLDVKNTLLKLAPENEKINLLESIKYDVEDMINADIDINKVLNDDLKKSILNHINETNEISDIINNKLKSTLEEWLNKAKWTILDTLDILNNN